MIDKPINFILNQNDVFPSSCQGLPALAQEILGWAGPRACTPPHLSISSGIIFSQVRSSLNESLTREEDKIPQNLGRGGLWSKRGAASCWGWDFSHAVPE